MLPIRRTPTPNTEKLSQCPGGATQVEQKYPLYRTSEEVRVDGWAAGCELGQPETAQRTHAIFALFRRLLPQHYAVLVEQTGHRVLWVFDSADDAEAGGQLVQSLAPPPSLQPCILRLTPTAERDCFEDAVGAAAHVIAHAVLGHPSEPHTEQQKYSNEIAAWQRVAAWQVYTLAADSLGKRSLDQAVARHAFVAASLGRRSLAEERPPAL